MIRLRVDARLGLLLDGDSFEERDAGLKSLDPLGFVDLKPYRSKLVEQRHKTGIRDAAVWGLGAIKGTRVSICAMDFAYMGGSMGSVVGEKVTRAAEAALAERVPYIAVSTSGGARMQEGTLALMQMVKTVNAVNRLKRYGLPYISILGDPSTGGAIASFAALGDVILEGDGLGNITAVPDQVENGRKGFILNNGKAVFHLTQGGLHIASRGVLGTDQDLAAMHDPSTLGNHLR